MWNFKYANDSEKLNVFSKDFFKLLHLRITQLSIAKKNKIKDFPLFTIQIYFLVNGKSKICTVMTSRGGFLLLKL